MKFVIACGIYPPEIGGPATVIAGLVRDLRADGHEVHVVTYGEKTATDKGVVRVSRKAPLPERYLRFSGAVSRLLDDGARLIATDVFSAGIPARLALIGRSNVFFVRLGGEWAWEDAVTNRGLRVTLREYWKSHAHGFRHALKVFFYQWVLKRATRILPTSKLLVEVLQRVVSDATSKMIVVSNASDVSVSECRKIHSETDTSFALKMIAVGRFAPVKNMPFFARVLKSCVEKGISVCCTFVGDGEELEETKKILKNISGMNFVGKKNHDEITKLIGEADVLALPSLSDICPNSVVEALACGVPCLITSEHGLPRSLQGVIECDPTDMEQWIGAIKRLSDASVYEALRLQVCPVSTVGPTLRGVVTDQV